MDNQKIIKSWYSKLEKQIPKWTEVEKDLSLLGASLDNESFAIHSWFNLKESFSANFPKWLIKYLKENYNFEPKRILDPFVGGGTSAIEFSRMGIQCIGVEYNPFIRWVAESKLHWHKYNKIDIENAIIKIHSNGLESRKVSLPKLTTFKNTKYFRSKDVRHLIQTLIEIEESDIDDSTKRFLSLGVASTVEKIANLRKDGRALRYFKKDIQKDTKEILKKTWTGFLADLNIQSEENVNKSSKIYKGSAVNLNNLRNGHEDKVEKIRGNSIDLVVYSPPYLNNFDYSEVYKLELWLLGFVGSYEQWRQVRLGTLRSHRSIKFVETSFLTKDKRTKHISEKVNLLEKGLEETSSANAVKGLAKSYFDDMFLALKEQYRTLKKDGYLAYLLANSCYSELQIQTDLILCEIAKSIGFTPLEIIVLKKRHRRSQQNSHIRESIVIMKK